MYPDNSLIPTEAIRLAALGSLATAPKPYAALAAEIRHFTGRIVRPSLDLLCPPLQHLPLHGLLARAGTVPDASFPVTSPGLAELHLLLPPHLPSPLRSP